MAARRKTAPQIGPDVPPMQKHRGGGAIEGVPFLQHDLEAASERETEVTDTDDEPDDDDVKITELPFLVDGGLHDIAHHERGYRHTRADHQISTSLGC